MGQAQTYKELVYERWRHSERKCYFLVSATGTSIGYALATFESGDAGKGTLLTLLALLVWACGVVSGLSHLDHIREEMDEIHRSLSIPLIESAVKNQDGGMEPSWAPIRDKINTRQAFNHNVQVTSLLLGSLIFATHKLQLFDYFGGSGQ